MNQVTDPRGLLERLYWSAVRRTLPSDILAGELPRVPKGRTVVVGAGKAAGAMAQAFDAAWPAAAPLEGLVVTRYGHTPPAAGAGAGRIEVMEAAHPVPDAASMDAAVRILSLVQGLTADDLVVCLISGGGSSLMTLPVPGLDMADKARINKALLESGADIKEMNCVRKHLSLIKGGRLAAACWPARVVTLAISDVPGDELSVIASGPTCADATTCAEALSIVDKYSIDVPEAVRAALADGSLVTPKKDNAKLDKASAYLIATPRQSLIAAVKEARALGIDARILSDEIEGESKEVGKVHAALARYILKQKGDDRRPVLLLSGGETMVTVRKPSDDKPRGRGGRAGEFCLGLAQGLQGTPRIWALAADTDDIDGIEDNAGAFVSASTLQRADQAGLNLDEHLATHDSYGYFGAIGDLFFSGPTFTNVNDFRAILII